MRKSVIMALMACSMPAAKAATPAIQPADTVMLPELAVEGPVKSDVTLLPLETEIISRKDIEKSAEPSLLPLLSARVAGLFTVERGMAGYGINGGESGTVNIRGIGQGNKVLFLIDGQPQWAGVFGHSVADTYSSSGVERVEVVKGPSSLLYGSNAMGGSINIITKSAGSDGFSVNARAMAGSYTTQRFDAGAGYRDSRFDASVSAGLDYSNGSRARSRFSSSTQLMKFNYTPSAHWCAGVTASLVQTQSENPGTTYEPLYDMTARLQRGTVSLHVRDNYGAAQGGAQIFANWGRHKIDDGYHEGEQPRDYIFNSTDYNVGATLYQTVSPWRGNNLSAGFDFMHWGGHNWNAPKAASSEKMSEARHHESEAGVYAMMQQELAAGILSLNAGIRYQYGTQYGHQWIPQAGFIVRPYAGASVKFSFGKGYRAPNIRELYLFPPHNPELRPEYLYNYDLELTQRLLSGRLALSVSLFYADVRDLIQTVPVDGRMKNINTGSLKNKGVEFEGSFRISRLWSVAANYSYLHTSTPITSAPRHKGYAAATYSPGRFEFTLSATAVGGLYTQIGSNASKESYFLLDAMAAYNVPWRHHLRLFLKADNITDSRYCMLYGFPMPGITVTGGLEFRL